MSRTYTKDKVLLVLNKHGIRPPTPNRVRLSESRHLGPWVYTDEKGRVHISGRLDVCKAALDAENITYSRNEGTLTILNL